MSFIRVAVVLTLVCSAGFMGFSVARRSHLCPDPSFAQIDKLMEVYIPLQQANDLLGLKDKTWRMQAKAKEDSLHALMERISAQYDNASPKGKQLLQSELELLNLEVDIFRHQNIRNTADSAKAMLTNAIDSLNTHIRAFGSRKACGVLFGSTNGTIVFGDNGNADHTLELVHYLNASLKEE